MSNKAQQSAIIRPVTERDMAAITGIYGYHVSHGLASFEDVPPDESEMRRRMIILCDDDFPYVVAELDGMVVGYSYAGPYRSRTGYRNSVENAVYLAPQVQGGGIGKTLLRAVIDRCTAMGFRQMVAVIGVGDSTSSIALHTSLGFEMVGTLRGIGFKLGHWVDTVHMQKSLGDGEDTPPTR